MKKVKTAHSSSAPSLSQLKSLKKPPLTPTTKKKPLKQSPSSTKHKQPPAKKSQEPHDYIIINDNIYSANTFTQRNNYEQFLHKVKKEKQIKRKSFLVKSQLNQDGSTLKKSRENSRKNKIWKKLSPQDFIQTMTLEEKKEMFFKLQDQIRAVNNLKQGRCQKFATGSLHLEKLSQPGSTESFQNQLSERKRIDSERQRRQKFSLLQEKLENLKMQLMFKWQGQLDRLDEMCRKGKLTEKQKQTKIAIIQKLKDHKLKILDCTKTLFEKILKEEEYEQQHSEQKANKIEAILQSLHSFPSLQSIDDHYLQKEPNIDHLKVKSPEKDYPQISPHKNLLNIDSSPLEIVEDNSHEAFLDDIKENSWDRNQSSNKSMEDFKSPLNFLNSSPSKGRYAQFEDGLSSIEQHKELNVLIKDNYSQQQIHSQTVFQVSKPLFGDPNEKISLKLDLRLDEVVFGQDEYPQCEKQDPHKLNQHQQEEEKGKFQNEQTQNDTQQISSSFQLSLKIKELSQNHDKQPKVEFEQQKPNEPQIVIGNTSPVSPPKVEKISMSKLSFNSRSPHQSQDELACKEQPVQKMAINIPMILSRQKMQTLALQQNRAFRDNFDKHIAFQMGCIQLQSSDPSVPPPFHFTTLVDINSYIVGFYEFMMKKYMASLVDNLNVPYGKSAIDKLYSLQTEGFVMEESYNQMNNILSENHFAEYQREIMFTMRKCTEYETAHNRAVFEAFTKCINVYRPYFDLEGEVYPWIVSEKGITFYEITEDNIEEVFEKSKIKVLQYCTALCGLHPPSEIKNDDQSALMNQKNEQNLNKMIKTQVLQQFEEWKIRFVNFQCLVRMLIAGKIYSDVMNEIVAELIQIEQAKDKI